MSGPAPAHDPEVESVASDDLELERAELEIETSINMRELMEWATEIALNEIVPGASMKDQLPREVANEVKERAREIAENEITWQAKELLKSERAAGEEQRTEPSQAIAEQLVAGEGDVAAMQGGRLPDSADPVLENAEEVRDAKAELLNHWNAVSETSGAQHGDSWASGYAVQGAFVPHEHAPRNEEVSAMIQKILDTRKTKRIAMRPAVEEAAVPVAPVEGQAADPYATGDPEEDGKEQPSAGQGADPYATGDPEAL